jgi:predicted ArsR family transcriptional regulator
VKALRSNGTIGFVLSEEWARSQILATLERDGPMSVTKLAHTAHFSPIAAAKVLADLLETELVEAYTAGSHRGQPVTQWCITGDARRIGRVPTYAFRAYEILNGLQRIAAERLGVIAS